MADDMHEDGREIWDVPAPPGGWGQPWPQCIELAMNLPAQHWTLVGGLMVQLHSARAALAVTRPTADVDIVLHLDTPATTVPQVQGVLAGMGYTLQTSIDSFAPAHRFVRGQEQVDVMVACVVEPLTMREQMRGSDRSRVSSLHESLNDETHRSWMLLEERERQRARMNLKILADNPQSGAKFRKVGKS
ncbi:hypothetical protein OOZ51_08450 [Arthrobacter sp. MI7-26]|uniref:hypothetical protein n=1 Tax=Arthrobacter sp. MI7-26 TaxID=2993653 RepID=UPI00224908D4|nr:hypothetical protein [Arthrobacter sp. MI7-26]MCX2747849.1 hypothetical protein [Arthrobacter sp. MI7-26]